MSCVNSRFQFRHGQIEAYQVEKLSETVIMLSRYSCPSGSPGEAKVGLEGTGELVVIDCVEKRRTVGTRSKGGRLRRHVLVTSTC